MKCPTCNQDVEVNSSYTYSLENKNDEFVTPCSTCANNTGNTDEEPCLFCKDNPDKGFLV